MTQKMKGLGTRPWAFCSLSSLKETRSGQGTVTLKIALTMEYLEPDLDDAPAPPKEKMEKKPPAEPKEKKAKKSIFEAGDISSYVASQLVTLLEKHIRKAWHSITDIELASLRLHGIFYLYTILYCIRVCIWEGERDERTGALP